MDESYAIAESLEARQVALLATPDTELGVMAPRLKTGARMVLREYFSYLPQRIATIEARATRTPCTVAA